MDTQVIIVLKDHATTDGLERELVARKLKVNRLTRDDLVRFGMKVGPVEGSPQEFLEIAMMAPGMIDALFDTIEKFRDRISLFINSQQTDISARHILKTSFRQPKTFDRFKRR